MSLPQTFPIGTLFGDVDGIAVSREPGPICVAWSHAGPRLFPTGSFSRAKLMYESQFRRWVDDRRLSPYSPGAPRVAARPVS